MKRFFPSLLAIFHIVLVFFLIVFVPLPWIAPPALQFAGLLIVILGFLFGFMALSSFRKTREVGKGSGLVTSGIYGITRNPVNLGFAFMLVGISLNAGSFWGIILLPLMVLLFNQFVILPEERALEKKFGKEYTNYHSKVRRWL